MQTTLLVLTYEHRATPITSDLTVDVVAAPASLQALPPAFLEQLVLQLRRLAVSLEAGRSVRDSRQVLAMQTGEVLEVAIKPLSIEAP